MYSNLINLAFLAFRSESDTHVGMASKHSLSTDISSRESYPQFSGGCSRDFPTALGSKFLVFLEKQNPKQNPVEIE